MMDPMHIRRTEDPAQNSVDLFRDPDISVRMVTDKCRDIQATGAGTLLAGDMGCLLNMAGRLKREGSSVKVRHVAEVLAGMTREAPPIGEAKEG